MKQSVDDVKRVVGILGPALDSTVVHEDFGTVMVRLEAREVNDSQLQALQSFADEVSSRPVNGATPAKLQFDAVSKRIYYAVPDKEGDGSAIGSDAMRSDLKQAGLHIANGR